MITAIVCMYVCMYSMYVCIKLFVHFILSFKTDCNFILGLKKKKEICFKLWTFKICYLYVYILKKKKKQNKLCYDLNSYYWRVVMTIEYNMITIMIMIVKAVIKKRTCKMLLKELSAVSSHTGRSREIAGKWLWWSCESSFRVWRIKMWMLSLSLNCQLQLGHVTPKLCCQRHN